MVGVSSIQCQSKQCDVVPSSSSPQVLDGCVCVNPGHLTRKATGGTFVKLCIPELPAKPDLTADVAVQIVHI